MKAIHYYGFRRLACSLAAGLGVVAALLAPATATAGRITLVSPTTAGITLTTGGDGTAAAECVYASLIGDPSGNLVFLCSGNPVAPEAGTLSINAAGTASGIPEGSGTTTFSVARSGGITGAVSGNLAVSGGCQLSANTVTFANNSGVANPATVTLSAGTALANTSCTVTLSTTTATLGALSSLTVGVTPQSPGQLVLSLGGTATTIPASTGSTTFSVVRNNGTFGTVTGALGVVGGCTLSSPSVSFTDGSTTPSPATITLAAGTASGGSSCTVTLTAGSGGVITGTPSTHVVSITTTTTTPPPPPGCTTNATRTVAWTGASGTSMFQDLKANESLAISVNMSSFPLLFRSNYLMQVVEGGSLSNGADVQFTVSNCPGDFNAGVTLGPLCHKHTSALGDSIIFKAGPPVSERTPVTCWLPAGTTTAYFNIRPILRPTPNPPNAAGIPSCPAGQVCKFSFALSR